MEQNIEILTGGIVCDKCDWKDDTISSDKYHQYINKPCPKCGENLLTLEDYQRAEMLLWVAHFMNSLPKEVLEQMNSKTQEESIDKIKNSPIFKDAKGLNELGGNEKVCVSFSTHKEIKALEITKSKISK